MTATQGRPWMTALEMQFAALKTARRSVAAGVKPGTGNMDALFRAECGVVDLLPRSQPYAWTTDTVRAVWTASRMIPSESRFDPAAFLDRQPYWWWFDWPLPIPMTNGFEFDSDDVDVQHISGLLLVRRPDDDDSHSGLVVCDFRQTFVGPALANFFVVRDKASLDDILKGVAFNPQTGLTGNISTRVAALSRFILAAAAWLSQRIVVFRSGHVERHRRKQLTREHAAIVSDVKVVELRRIESQPHETPSGSPVDWSCRWIVNGHWRNQIYAHGERKLIYIMPFVKGPTDKPLRVPTHTVYQVSR